MASIKIIHERLKLNRNNLNQDNDEQKHFHPWVGGSEPPVYLVFSVEIGNGSNS